MTNVIKSLAPTRDKTQLFVSDWNGNLKLLNVTTEEVYDFGKVHCRIFAILLSPDEQMLFTADT